MKTNPIMRGYTGLHAFFPTIGRNVQEVEPTSSVSVASSPLVVETDTPRLLTKRNARWARRIAH